MKKPRKVVGRFEHPGLRNASKTLLANIRFASDKDPIKTICVTSTVVDEGKSTVASNLACAMATSGKKTLIVDADMRRRSLGQMLGKHSESGLYSVISGEAMLKECILKTSLPNLYFMDSELDVPNPPDILATKRFEALLDRMKELFDYVIIDTPPVGLFPDAAVVAHVTDGALLVIRQDGIDRNEVKSSLEQLQAAEANVIGSVLTFVPDDASEYYYAYYHSEEDGSKRRRKNKGKNQEEGLTVIASELLDEDITEWAELSGVAQPRPSRGGTKKASHSRKMKPLPEEIAEPEANLDAASTVLMKPCVKRSADSDFDFDFDEEEETASSYQKEAAPKSEAKSKPDREAKPKVKPRHESDPEPEPKPEATPKPKPKHGRHASLPEGTSDKKTKQRRKPRSASPEKIGRHGAAAKDKTLAKTGDSQGRVVKSKHAAGSSAKGQDN